MGDGRVQGLDGLGGEPHSLALAARVGAHQHVGSGLQEVAGTAENFREDGELEDAGRVRHLDEGEAVAARRGPFLFRDHRPRELEADIPTGPELAEKRRRANHVEAFQSAAIGVERMGRQVEPDGLEFMAQAFHGRPRCHFRVT